MEEAVDAQGRALRRACVTLRPAASRRRNLSGASETAHRKSESEALLRWRFDEAETEAEAGAAESIPPVRVRPRDSDFAGLREFVPKRLRDGQSRAHSSGPARS